MTRETGISFSQMFLRYLTVPCEQRFLSHMAFSVKKTTQQTSQANDFVNAKSHGREKPLLLIGVLI